MRESRYNVWIVNGEYHYVFNALSGCFIRLTDEEQQSVEKLLVQGVLESNHNLVQKLVENRMLVADAQDELATLNRRFLSSRYDRRRFALTIVTSLGCNYDCAYCYELKQPSLIGDDVAESLLQLVNEKYRTLNRLKSVGWVESRSLARPSCWPCPNNLLSDATNTKLPIMPI